MNTSEKPRSTGRRTGFRKGLLSGRAGSATLRSVGFLAVVAAVPYTMGRGPAERSDAFPAAVTNPAVILPLDVAEPRLSDEANQRIDYWIRRFQTDQRATIDVILTQEGAFGDLIRDKLRQRDMPTWLIHLAMIESGLRPRAVSRVEAVGVWQFMGPTAQAYGLRVDDWVDERRDPVKATDAALDYLQWLHEQYGSWHLAAAAYNAGPTRVNRILRQRNLTGLEGDDVYWAIRGDLPKETREYVPRMLAVKALVDRWERGELQELEVSPKAPYSYEQVWVPGGTPLHGVADGLGIERDVVWALNPHLIKGVTPPGEAYPLRVPDGKAFTTVATLGGRPGRVRRADD